MRKITICLVALLIAAIVSVPALGQTENGNILGDVRDPSGAVVPKVTVTLEEQHTGLNRTVVTLDNGSYRFALVPLGDYTITLEHPGFKKVVNRDVHLLTNQTLRVDVTLEVGATTAQVTVEAKAAAITTDTAEVVATVPTKFLTDNPTSNFGPVAQLSMMSVANTNDRGMVFGMYGSRLEQAATTVDGQEFGIYNDYILAYAVQEVKTNALVSPAKYQRPVTVDTVTKQGTNQFHGKFEFSLHHNYFTALDPRTHPAHGKCSVDYQCTGTWTSGITVDGPVWIPKVYDGRNRTFWMFSYTPQKNSHSSTAGYNLIPTANQQAGLISAFSPAPTNPFTGLPFTGTNIPINPVTAKILPLYPSPDTPGGGTATITSAYADNEWHTYAARVDQKIGQKDVVNFSLTRFVQIFAWDFGDRSIKGYMGLANGQWFAGTYGFGYTHTFSPAVVNEARVGWNWEGPTGYTAQGVDVTKRMTDWGMTGVPTPRISLPVTGPDISITGLTGFLGWGTNTNKVRYWDIHDNLSIQHGRHTLQMGPDFKLGKNDNGYAGTDAYPSYTFDGRFSGNAFADFLLGLPGTIGRTNYPPVQQAHRKSIGAYIQDDFRVSSKLTLNLGVRYDWIAPEWETNGMQYNFDVKTGKMVVPTSASLSLIDPNWPLNTNPIVTASQAGFPTNLMVSTSRLVPRIGFAYRPFNNANTVIRGGYGIYVVPDWQTGANGNGLLFSGGVFGLSTTFQNAMVGGVPLLQWPVAFASGGTTGGGSPNISGVNPNFHYPYTQQWNLTIERAIGRHGLRLSYIGTKDTQLGYTRNINLPPPSTTPFTASRYIYPNFNTISYVDNGGNADYHSFESELTTRNFHGIVGKFGYAWAKQMTDVPNQGFENISGSGIQNPYCLECERARSDYVPLHRFNGDFSWDLPVGRGKEYGSSWSRGLNLLAGNWLLTSSTRARTGYGFSPVFSGFDVSNTNTFGGRPDLVGNPKLANRTDGLWYNLAAFAIPAHCAAGQAAPCGAGRFGNMGRNILDGPAAFWTGLGVFKRFPVKEHFMVVFSCEINNLLNHPVWTPDPSPWSPSPVPINAAANAGQMYQGYVGTSRGDSSMRSMVFNLGFEF